MTDQQTLLEKLTAFRKRDKFSASSWNERGLNPSDSEMCIRLEKLFNECAENLIEATNSNSSKKNLKSVLKNGLANFKRSDFDTEESEFICDYFFQLSNILEVDFKDNLNSWLYGSILNAFFKVSAILKRTNKAIETLSQDCTKCNSKLETFIYKKENGIPDYNWTIIQCDHCNEYNLLSIGPNIKEMKYGNYKPIEQLDKSEFTEDQAKIRLEQIKYFRKK